MRPDNNDSEWDRSSGGLMMTARPQGPVVVQGGYSQLSTDLRYDAEATRFDVNLREYWQILVKRRLVIAAVVAGAIALALLLTVLMRPIYSATATIQIDREAANIVNLEGVEPSEMQSGADFMQTQYGLLQSRSLAERVVDNLGLANDEQFLDSRKRTGLAFWRGGDAPNGTLAERRERAVRVLMKNLAVEPERNSRLVRITYQSPYPAVASRVSDAVADNFIGAQLDRRFEASSYARKFLEDRIAQVKQRLEDTERQLVAYAGAQQIINVPTADEGSGGGAGGGTSLTASDLVALNSSLSAAKGERIRAEQRWRQAQSVSGMALPEVLQSPSIQALRQAKATLSTTYQQKLNVYKPDYPEMVQMKSQIDEIDRQIEAEVGNIKSSLRNQYQVALAQERSLGGHVSGLKSDVLDLRNRSIQYNILQREVDTNRTLYDGLLQRYKEIGVAGGVGTNNISIVDRAQTPTSPSRPKPLFNLGIGAMLGLLFGVLLAFILEALDDTIKSVEDVEGKLGLASLGVVPVLDKGATPEQELADARSPFSEAYYSIRTALQFSTTEGAPRSLFVTSARPAEGKSTTSIALARNFARLGMRVLLIDGDLRNPSLHRSLGLDNSSGFSTALTGAGVLADVMQVSDLPNMMVITAGPLPPNPAELLATPRLRAFVSGAEAEFDLVVIDGPPVMGFADAPLLAAVIGGTLLIVSAGTTRRGVARTALERLRVGRARVLGAILTKFDGRRAPAGYGYGYGYGYDYDYGTKPQLAPR